jgi:hypothetical protein
LVLLVGSGAGDTVTALVETAGADELVHPARIPQTIIINEQIIMG